MAVATGTERILLDANGPATVKSLWMALGGGNGPALDARLRVYYDSAAVPSIDIDMGTLLATHFGAGSVAGSHTLAHVHATCRSPWTARPRPAIVSTGTEDWFDSAWYFNGWKDFDAGVHSYVGTRSPRRNEPVRGRHGHRLHVHMGAACGSTPRRS